MVQPSLPSARPTASVVILTTAFPLHPVGEVTFVRPELEPLVRRFDRVIVVPSVLGAVSCALPEGVTVDHGLAKRIHPRSSGDVVRLACDAVGSRWLATEIARCPRLALLPSSMRRLLFCAGAAVRAGRWVAERLGAGDWDPRATLIYSYWLNHLTAGVGRARLRFPGLQIVSRAHGADIYQDRYPARFLPLHPQAIAAADRVFAASEAGRQELARRYPRHRAKLHLAPLGSVEPGVVSRSSTDGRFRVVSCGSLARLKRVDLLVESLGILAAERAERCFEWHHLGGGAEQAAIERLAHERLPGNVLWALHGSLPPERVLAFYRDHAVDLFVSTSSSEGRPVSMMEAMSCGVPVVATAVGGVPELIGPDRGWLLPESAPAADIARVLATVVDQVSLESYRISARRFWEQRLRAERNADEFAGVLRSLTCPESAGAADRGAPLRV